jgi:hypothetical protein
MLGRVPSDQEIEKRLKIYKAHSIFLDISFNVKKYLKHIMKDYFFSVK